MKEQILSIGIMKFHDAWFFILASSFSMIVNESSMSLIKLEQPGSISCVAEDALQAAIIS